MTHHYNQSTSGGMENPSQEAEHDFNNPEEPPCSNDDAISFLGRPINDHVRYMHTPTDTSTGEGNISDWPDKTLVSDDKPTGEDNTAGWPDKTIGSMGLVHCDAEKQRETDGKTETPARLGDACRSNNKIKGPTFGECICGQIGTSKCSRCLAICYCSKPCQRSHWRIHKTNCIDAHFKFVVKHFVERQVYGCCLIASMILVERLRKYNIVAFIKDGYCVDPGKSFASRHVWVENANGIQFDISFSITAAVLPETASMRCTLFSELPQGVIRTDNETAEERKALRELENGITMVHRKKMTEILLKAPGNIYEIYAICIQ